MLLEELRSFKQVVAELVDVKQKVIYLSEKLEDAFKIIHKQLYLESLDNKSPQHNLIITGVSQDEGELGETDDEKVNKVLGATRIREIDSRTRWIVKRLGQPNDRKKTPMHVTVNDQR